MFHLSRKYFYMEGQTLRARIKNRSEKNPPVLQNYRMMKGNKEVKTSPVELGNCCQEWAGPPAVMRQHRVHVCINTDRFSTLNYQTPKDQTRIRGTSEGIQSPRQSLTISEAEEEIKDIEVVIGGLIPMREKTNQL